MKTPAKEREVIEEFIGITQANKSVARKYLKNFDWNLNAAVNEYFASEKPKKVKIDTTKLEKLFDTYKDSEEDAILADGIEKYCNDLEIDPMDVVMIVFSYNIHAQKMCEFKREDFLRFWSEKGCETIEQMKEAFPAMRRQLENQSDFEGIYKFSFDFGREEGQKSLSLDMALALWELLLPSKFLWLEHWCTFVRENHKKSISRDSWNLLLDFIETIDKDLSNYDPMGAWPVIIDEFTEYLKLNKIVK